jgi:hypothetical protein
MELIWLVLALLVVDVAALLFAADTRPGLQHTPRPGLRRSMEQAVRPGLRRSTRHAGRTGLGRSIGG